MLIHYEAPPISSPCKSFGVHRLNASLKFIFWFYSLSFERVKISPFQLLSAAEKV